MCEHIEIFAALAARFGDQEIRERSQAGRTFPYVTARTVMNRLDEVLGPSNWWDDYQPIDGAVICKLTVRLPDGSTLTKSDVGGYSKTQDESDVEKTGFSDAFKRAAVKFGVARYLYGDGLPAVIVAELQARRAAQQPRQPAALPGPGYDSSAPRRPIEAAGTREEFQRDQAEQPRTGKNLFGWAKERDLLKWFDDLGRAWRFPNRMIHWSDDQVDQAFREWKQKGPNVAARDDRRAAAG